MSSTTPNPIPAQKNPTPHDLLIGQSHYPCHHEFTYIQSQTLIHKAARMQEYPYPKCVEGASDDAEADAQKSCAHCDAFFVDKTLVEERRAKLEAEGLRVGRGSMRPVVERAREVRRRGERRERLLKLTAVLEEKADGGESSSRACSE